MKFVRYMDQKNANAPALPGLLSPDGRSVLNLSSAENGGFASMVDLISSLTDEMLGKLRETREGWVDIADVRLLAPIERPIHDILCVGVNYHDHREETHHTFDTSAGQPLTVYFGKRAGRLLGPGETLRAHFDLDTQVDYEVELAVVIGKRGVNIPKEQAESYIFGYSVFNDFSSRRLQKAHQQWYRGKSLDGYAAMGPCILHRSALPFPVEVPVQSRVNGEIRQQSNTRLLIADIPSIIADVSLGMTLEPGDIIATGTPAGVGMGFTPPRFLKPGDTVACEIEPIGILENHIEA